MKKVERYFYPAVFTYEPGQEIAIDFPDLKCATSGVNDDERAVLVDVYMPISTRKKIGTEKFNNAISLWYML